jgi:hypothetical protein
MIEKRYCITFAAPVGSSKTPIAHYLSWNLGLLIYSNDATRIEVAEDLLGSNQDEYIKRRDERGERLIKGGKSFIYDASIDREWHRLHAWLTGNDYEWFIISLDLTKGFLEKIYEAKGYTEVDRLDVLLKQHRKFLADYGDQVGLHISDETFARRLELSLAAVTDRFVHQL